MVVKALETITLARVDDGTDGNDITSYASGTVLPTAVAPTNSQFWLTNSDGVAIKFYKSTGTAWVEQQISAAAINAATFNGLTFTGVTFNGSTFKSTFENVQPYGFTYKVHGASTLTDGALITDAYNDANVQVSHTELNQTGLLAQGFMDGSKAAEIALGQGQLQLGAAYKASSTAPVTWMSGALTPDQLLAMMRCGNLAWQGVLYPQAGDTARMSIPLSQTQNGWLIRWSYFNSKIQNAYYNYTLLPKAAIKVPSSSKTIIMMLSMPTVGVFSKLLWYNDTDIAGDSSNNKGTQAPFAVMDAVFAF